jgi:hypothetical protein
VTTESISTLLRHIESLSELALSYQNYSSKDSLDAVVHKLEVIGVCAGDHNMPGFQDVCFLLEDFLLETPNGSVYKAIQQQQLLSCIELARNYINQANDANAEKVLNIFKVDCWTTSLLQTDTNFMKEILLKSGGT